MLSDEITVQTVDIINSQNLGMGSPWSHCSTQPLPPTWRLPPAWLPWKQLLLCHFCFCWHRRGESFHLVPEIPKEDWLPICRISKLEQILKCLVFPDFLLMRNSSDWFMNSQWQRTALCHHPLSQYLYQSLKPASWTMSLRSAKIFIAYSLCQWVFLCFEFSYFGNWRRALLSALETISTPFVSFFSLNNVFSLLLPRFDSLHSSFSPSPP